MNQTEALARAENYGALLHGHFVGTQGGNGTGLHMPMYFDGRVLVTKPREIVRLAGGIANMLFPYGVEVVVGMPIGAYTLGSGVAADLDADYAMAEKDGRNIVVARTAFVDVVRGRRVALVEDTVTSGGSLLKGIAGVEAAGGILVAIGALFDRGRVRPGDFGVPYHPLIQKAVVTLTREECLEHGQCSRGEPIDRHPGHGHKLEELVQKGTFVDAGYTFR